MFISVNNKNIIKFLVLFVACFLFFVLLEIISTKSLNFKFIEIFLLCSIIVNIMAYMFEAQKQYYKHFMVVLLLFLSVFYIKTINHLNIGGSNLKFTVAFYTGITNFLLLLSCLLNKKYKILNYVIHFILLFPTLFIWQYFFISDSFLSVDALLAIFQTNFSEAKTYMYTFMGIKQYIGLFLLLAISFFIICYNNKLKLTKINRKIIILLIVSILLNIFLVCRYKDNVVTKIAVNTKEYLNEYDNFKKLVSERKIDDIKFNEIEKIDKGIYVLVIGESQNKKHMSSYGYNKKTTPWLDSMEKDKNFIKFENGFSCHTHTVPVLSYALTSKNQYNNIKLSNAISILDVAKAADMKTVWLSNQVHYGGLDTPLSVIADTAEQQKWINGNFGDVTDTDFYDIKLLDELNKITLSDNMLIVVHLMGSHVSYRDRYPSEFNVFKNEKSSIYDNSILYNDFVVENLLKKIKSLPNFKALIYFADHSEEIEQELSHGADQFVPEMTYIPVYMYFSDLYIKDNPQIYKNLFEHKDSFFTNDLIFNLLMGILNIKIQNVYEQNNDITNEQYDNDISRFKTLHGTKRIVDM